MQIIIIKLLTLLFDLNRKVDDREPGGEGWLCTGRPEMKKNWCLGVRHTPPVHGRPD